MSLDDWDNDLFVQAVLGALIVYLVVIASITGIS